MNKPWTHTWHEVHDRIHRAEASAGRRPGQVQLLAVSKTFAAQAVQELAQAVGQRDFGENYIQEGVDKITALNHTTEGPNLIWHCIGPIQSNKTRLVSEHFHWAHTVDRLRKIGRAHV